MRNLLVTIFRFLTVCRSDERAGNRRGRSRAIQRASAGARLVQKYRNEHSVSNRFNRLHQPNAVVGSRLSCMCAQGGWFIKRTLRCRCCAYANVFHKIVFCRFLSFFMCCADFDVVNKVVNNINSRLVTLDKEVRVYYSIQFSNFFFVIRF